MGLTKLQYEEASDMIIDYYNKITNQKRRYSKNSRNPIIRILKEGFTLEDCQKVINIKYNEWKNDSLMNKYIRIETLFNRKNFEKYLNQEYRKDDLSIYQLKNMPYREYLQTNHWDKVKKVVRERAKNKCQLCGTTKGQMNVHHNNYEHRGEELDHLEDVILLCRDCHSMYHNRNRPRMNESKALAMAFLALDEVLYRINTATWTENFIPELKYIIDDMQNKIMVYDWRAILDAIKEYKEQPEKETKGQKMYERYQNEKRKNIKPNGSAYIGQVLFLGSMKISKIRGKRYYDFITENGDVFLHTKADIKELERVPQAKKYKTHKIDKSKTIEEMRSDPDIYDKLK